MGRGGGRAWWFVVVALACAVVSPVASMLTRDASGRAVTVWVVVQATTTGMAFLIPQVRQIRSEQRQVDAEEREFDVRVGAELVVNDALEPILRLLGELAVETKKVPRAQLRAQAVPLVLATATSLIGPERSRACWFALEPGPPERLVPTDYFGRAGEVTTVFERGSPAGDAALELVTRGIGLRLPDLGADDAAGWALDATSDHRSVIAVAVTVSNVAYGMITLDALEPESLTADDMSLLKLVAGALAVALSIK